MRSLSAKRNFSDGFCVDQSPSCSISTKGFFPMKRTSTFALFVALLVGNASFLTACNTVEGAGKDIKKGGQAIENSADRNK
jgi:entericidin B